jgi:hypothetical protein
MTRLKMTPNSTNARRKIEHFAFRARANGARIRNLSAESSQNQVSVLISVHQNSISRATPVVAPRRGHQSAPGSGQAGFSMLHKNYREPLWLMLGAFRVLRTPYPSPDSAETSCRNQLSSQTLAHTNAVLPGHQSGHGFGRVAFIALQKHFRETWSRTSN